MSHPLRALQYMWSVTAGYRLRPWRSPYVRWRLETYFGESGDVHNGRQLLRLLWRERREMNRFLDWVTERRAEQDSRGKGGGG